MVAVIWWGDRIVEIKGWVMVLGLIHLSLLLVVVLNEATNMLVPSTEVMKSVVHYKTYKKNNSCDSTQQ